MNHFRGQSSSRPPFGHDRSPNMQSAFLPELHRWISKLISRHLHACSPGDLLITMVKETVILVKKEFQKMKKKSYLSLIWKRWKREMTARLPVTVSSVQTWFYMYAYVKKSSPGSTQLPTSRHLLSPPTCATMTHTHTHTHTHARTHTHIHLQDGWSPWSPQASYDRRRHRNCFPTRKSASISEKVNISWGHRSVDALFTCVDLHVLHV